MTTTSPPVQVDPPAGSRDDRLLAPTRWTARAVVPVLVAAFVILYLFPGETVRLWSWMICPEMSALVMGGGYLSGAYFFTRVAASREWHRVAVGFVATTVFATLLLVTTVLHWDSFNHDHVSFWAWLGLYGSTPVLLPVLWWKNRRTDPGARSNGERALPRRLRVAVGIGGTAQLGLALVMFGWPHLFEDAWPWELNAATARSTSAFIAFPAVTWLWFLFEDRWSSFRITQQTATFGLALVAVGAVRARREFSDAWQTPAYVTALLLALVLNVALYVALERRANPAATE